jgi:hypothetical protein
MEYISGFLITLALVPVIGLSVVYVMREMTMGSLGAIEGIIAIGVLLALFVASIVSRTPVVAGATLVIVLTLAAFYPFAETQLSRQVGREINVARIDKAHEALSARPDNVAAWFALSQGLYSHGFHGHAIAIAEDVLNRLSGQVTDDFSGRSMRDIFRNEELTLKAWKQRALPELCRPLKCPFCGHPNPPGPLACAKCGQAYLLELARSGDLRRKFVGKLVVGWALLALTITGAAYAGALLKGGIQTAALAGLVLATGGLLWWLFRPHKGDETGSWEL